MIKLSPLSALVGRVCAIFAPASKHTRIMDDKKRAYREVLGERLADFRRRRGLTAADVARLGGITAADVEAVESGAADYPMDTFLGYVAGSGLYMYFAEKSEGRKLPHDYDDIAAKAVENDPKL